MEGYVSDSLTSEDKFYALLKEKENFQEFLRNSTELIYCLDFKPPISIEDPVDKVASSIIQNAHYAFANDAYGRLLGITPSQLIGRPASDYFNEENNAEAMETFVRADYFLLDYRIDGYHNGLKTHFLNNTWGTVEDGFLVRMWGTSRNITKQIQAEQETALERQRLFHMDRIGSLGMMASSLAHELNQPLTGILSNAQALELIIQKTSIDRKEMAVILSDIVYDTKRAGSVIRNLRDLYSEQSGDYEDVDLRAVVNDTLVILHSEFISHSVTVDLELGSNELNVTGNRIQLQQVLLNLILNGQEAMSQVEVSSRRLCITAGIRANEAVVSVSDSGVGIAPKIVDAIFEPLATWKPGGTGMGLAISDSIIRAHGGSMWAENLPEGGAKVGFAIPALKDTM